MSRTFELRTYTLASPERFGVTTHGEFRENGAAVVVALVSLPDGVDPDAVSRAFLASDAFRADMAGFSMTDILEVSTRVLEAAAAASPLQ